MREPINKLNETRNATNFYHFIKTISKQESNSFLSPDNLIVVNPHRRKVTLFVFGYLSII